MQLEHEFTVPVPVDEAWRVLLDVERVAPCMPGATLQTFTGDEFTGRVKVKVGPITVTYGGQGTFVERDEANHSVVMEASGKEMRGQGTAKATVHTRLQEDGDTTRVSVVTDLNITGRPAQFGRGVMTEVGGKLIDKFARCLAEEISGRPEPAPAEQSAEASASAATGDDDGESRRLTTVPSQPGPENGHGATASTSGSTSPGATATAPATGAQPPRWEPPRREAEPIDLLDTAGLPVLKRLGPVAGAVVLLAVLVWWWRRRH